MEKEKRGFILLVFSILVLAIFLEVSNEKITGKAIGDYNPSLVVTSKNRDDPTTGILLKDLVMVDTESGTESQLTTAPFRDFCTEFSIDKKTISFIRQTNPPSGFSSELYLTDVNSRREQNLQSGVYTIFQPGAETYCPKWSPDGTELIYLKRNLFGFPVKTGIAKVSTSRVTTSLTFDPTDDDISWFPDGTKILFVRKDSSIGEFRIFTINKDGSNLQQITSGSYIEADRGPKVSPDQKFMAFNRYPPLGLGLAKLVIKDLATTQEYLVNTGLYYSGWQYYDVKWSPDGKRFLYHCEKTTGVGGVCLVTLNYDNLANSKVQGLTDPYLSRISHYEWISNKQIVFEGKSVDSLDTDVHTMKVKPSIGVPRKITSSTFRNGYDGKIATRVRY